jgi:phosphohistidine phosphatase SixA
LSIFVVRHAKAGSRRDWDGDDTERPLSKGGRRQAAAISGRLAREAVTGLWSSPYVRCVQTLEPLGEALGLEVVVEPRLAEGIAPPDVLALLGELPDGAVLCSHGDIIPELLDSLVRRGTRVVTEPDWRKASIWVLDPPDADGHVATASAEPPPE